MSSLEWKSLNEFEVPSLTVCALTAVAIGVTYLIIRSIYRLTLHPLAKYPGPFLAKVSTFYGVYHAYIGDMHLDIERLHKNHGTFIRYAPSKLVIGSVEGFHDIYDSGKPLKKAKSYAVHGANNLLGIQDKGRYSRKKRIYAQAFSDSAIRGHEDKVIETVYLFCEKVLEGSGDGEEWGEVKDMSAWCSYLTTDIITRVVFTTTWSLLAFPLNRGVTTTSSTIVRLLGIAHQNFFLYSYKYVMLLFFPNLAKSSPELKNYATKLMESSMQARREKEVNDVLGLLMDAKDPESKTGEGFTEQDVTINSMNLLVAGSDTSSSALAATFFYLSRNPTAYEKVVAEVREKFKKREDIRAGAVLNSCIYVRAALNEAMRMSPVVAQPLWREVESGGAEIDGKRIPAGVNVGAGIYTLHHTASVFPDPYKYDIERWVVQVEKDEEEEKERIKGYQRAFAPFSTGPRQCLAKNFAVMELMLTMTTVVWGMDFEGVGDKGVGEKGEFKLESFFTSHMEGPLIRFKRKE